MDFSDIPVSSLINADFRLCGGGPVIRPFDSPIAADLSLLTPDDSPDGKWHMFFHTLLGVYHFVSADGISFSKKKRILSHAMRPNVNRTDNGYVLFYEKTTGLLSKGLNVIGLANCVKYEPVYFALRHSSAVSSSLRIRQYASFVFLAAKYRKTK